MQRPSRRQVLAALTGSLAGCTGDGDSGPRTSSRTASTPATTSPPPTATSSPTATESETETATETSTPVPDLDLGVVYIPFVGSKFGRCTTVSHPEVGTYGDPVPAEIARTHARWLADAGVSTVMFNFGEEDADWERLRAFLNATPASDLRIEPFYVVTQALRRGRNIDDDFAFLRDQLLSTDRCRTRDGRPVVTFWNVNFIAWGGNDESSRVQRTVLDTYGSYAGFVSHIREELTVDGTEPFLVAGVSNAAIDGMPDEYAELDRQFDGATNWTGLLRAGETVPWDEALANVSRSFAATRAFCDEHGMAYHPMTFPGFDDRHNTCWGGDRHVPRDPSHLRDLLALAREHTTDGRVNVATFNDWTEGHQIEPGRFRDESYGHEYLDVLSEFTP